MLLGILFAQQINKSAKLDKEATKKNIKAFTKIADANARLEKCQSDLLNQLQINAKRKNGLITYHLSMFQEQYSIIRKIQFGRGKGIEEIEKLDATDMDIYHVDIMDGTFVPNFAMSVRELNCRP